jgi:hypothetical protein
VGTRETYERTLVEACLIAGDEEALAKRLNIPVQQIVDWLLGAPVPDKVFLRFVDLVLDERIAVRRQHVIDVRKFLEDMKVRRAKLAPKQK